jgi:alkylhydroperoxidase family enzyme
MWQNPAVFKAMMGFGRKAEKWKRLDPNLATLATMAAAGRVGCSFCLDLHYFMDTTGVSTRPRHGRSAEVVSAA